MEKEILGVKVRIFPVCKPSGYIGFNVHIPTGDAGKPWKRLPNTLYQDANSVEEALELGEQFYINYKKTENDRI